MRWLVLVMAACSASAPLEPASTPLALGEVVSGAISTAFYVPNFLFAVQGTDYLAGTSPSVFQHYWSLGI